MKEILVTAATFNTLINDSFILKSLKRRISQQKDVLDKSFSINPSDYSFQFYCCNGVNLKWSEVFELLINYQNEGINISPISLEKLLQIAEIISTNIITSASVIENIDSSKTDQILKFFPVTYVKTEIGQFFINLKEFIYTPGSLEILFDEGSQSTQEDENAEKINYEPTENVRTKELVNKGGQRSIVELFPNIIDITSEFLKQQGLAAQCRRRNDTGYSSGVTVSQIRKHLLEFVPGLREHNISHSTVRRFFEAPHTCYNASARYKGYIGARVGAKCNSYREPNKDAHYLFARNKFRREFVSLFPRSSAILSTDDMAKIKVGPPAVSRYHQMRKIFLKGDEPNLPDHDFPIPGYLLNTSGYMWLQNNNSQQGDNVQSSSSFDITDNNEKQPQYFIDNMIASQHHSLYQYSMYSKSN